MAQYCLEIELNIKNENKSDLLAFFTGKTFHNQHTIAQTAQVRE